MSAIRLFAAISLFAAVLFIGNAAPAQATGTRPPVTGRLDRIFRERLPKLECGVVIGWADEQKPFFELHPETPLIPASNQKLVTAAAAVLALGLSHDVKTELIGHGVIADGALKGALRVRGEGDPTFGARDHGETLTKLTFFAERLKARGIAAIDGDILVDDSAFDQDFTGPEWPSSDPRTTSYLAQVAALSLDDGCARVMVTPGPVGRAPALQVVPDVGYVTIKNSVTTAAKGSGMRFEREDGSNDIVVSGTIARGSATQRHDVAIHDPAMHFGRALHVALRQAGITIAGSVRRAQQDERTGGEVLLRYGTPLSRILPAMLKESMNARAEMVAKHLGYAAGGGGSFAGGGAAIAKALEATGIDASKLTLADGSGLSRKNRVTARALHQILVVLAKHPSGEEFRECLAEPGEEGTLRRRFLGIEGRLFAKTGTLNAVSSLSGYVQTKTGKWIAFAFLMNGADPNIRKMQDQAVELLAAIDGEG